MTVKNPGWWMDQIHKSVGKYVNLETVDGVIRGGRLSGLRLDKVTFNGQEADAIRELELNGDPTDCVEMYRIKRIDLQPTEN